MRRRTPVSADHGISPVENLLAVLVSCEDEVLLETGCKYLKSFRSGLLRKKLGRSSDLQVRESEKIS